MEITINTVINAIFLIGFGLLVFLLKYVFKDFNNSIDKLNLSIEHLNTVVNKLHSRVSRIEGKLERD